MPLRFDDYWNHVGGLKTLVFRVPKHPQGTIHQVEASKSNKRFK